MFTKTNRQSFSGSISTKKTTPMKTNRHDRRAAAAQTRIRRSISGMPQEMQVEARRRATEKGGDPAEHMWAMIQESLDEEVAAPRDHPKR
jgi:hypothetical protein